jgi:hypothetical protein
MKNSIYVYALLILTGCKSISQSNETPTIMIDFKSWHSAVVDSFENKTDYSKGAKKEFGTALGVVHSAIQGFSEANLTELFNRSNAKNGDWDRMFILDFFTEGETFYEITSILLYKKSKYRGVSFDGSDFYNLRYVPKFKVWKLNSNFEYGNNGYVVISEFNKQGKNIENRILIGVPYYEVNEKILKIYDSAIFD